MPNLQIERMTFGGSGFGKLEGKACFVPNTAPGDLVGIRIEKSKKSYSEGVLEKLISPSPHRILPVCPLFGKCGGCNWQHISYREQCRQKELIFTDILWRIARIDSEKILPIISAPSPFEYRRRIQLKADFTDGRLSLGFHRKSSHDVIDINGRCEISAEPLNLAIAAIRKLISSFKEPNRITQIDLASSSEGLVSAIFHYSGSFPETLAIHLANAENNSSALHSVSILTSKHSTLKHVFGAQMLKYTVPSYNNTDLDLYYAASGFSQVNFEQNRVIVEILLNLSSAISPRSVLDLFCGNGNFSLPLAGSVEKVLGVESSEESVSSARYNAAVNTIDNARFLCMDSAAAVKTLDEEREIFDLVIMDPPRTGADEVSRKLAKVGASHLIYISCDPPTLGRDISILEKSGFAVISIQPVDMFPQTYHLESVALFKAI